MRRCGFANTAASGAWVFQLALTLVVASAVPAAATAAPAWQSQAAREQAAEGHVATVAVAAAGLSGRKTSSSGVWSISPTQVTARIATRITLNGTVEQGDEIAWVTASCDAPGQTLDPTDGVDKATYFTFATNGSYKLCFRASGDVSFVEIPGVSLEVLEDCVPEVAPTFQDTCTVPATSAQECSDLARRHPAVDDLGDNPQAIELSKADDRPPGCFWQASDSTHTDAALYFNPDDASAEPCSDSYRCVCCSAGASDSLAIAGVTPSEAVSGEPIDIVLLGTTTLGDRVAWVPNGTSCLAAAAYLEPAPGAENATRFIMDTAGVYRLCFWPAGSAEPALQDHVRLEVASVPEFEECAPILSSSKCTWPMQTAEHCQTMVNRHAQFPVNGGFYTQNEADRPHGCWFQSGANTVYYNINSNSPEDCSQENRPCVCCSPTTTTTVSTTVTFSTSSMTSTSTSSTTSTSTFTRTTTTATTTTTTTVTLSSTTMTATTTTTATSSSTASSTTSATTTTATTITATSTTTTITSMTRTTTWTVTMTASTTTATHTTSSSSSTVSDTSTPTTVTVLPTSTTRTASSTTTTFTASTATFTTTSVTTTHTTSVTILPTGGSDTTVTSTSVGSGGGRPAVPTDSSTNTTNETVIQEFACGNFSCPPGYTPKLELDVYCSDDCIQECCETRGALYLVLGIPLTGRRLDTKRGIIWFYRQPSLSTPDLTRPAAQPGSYVRGLDRGDGWLQVGTHFLPFIIQGVEVLEPQVIVFSNGSFFAPVPLWVSGLWGACMPECGPGRQSRLVLCPERYGQPLCEWSGERPPEQMHCMNAMPCPLQPPDENAIKAAIYVWAIAAGVMGALCVCPFLLLWFCYFWPAAKRAEATAKDRSTLSKSEVQKHWDLEAVASTQGVPVFDFEEVSDSTKSSSCATLNDVRGSSDITFAPGTNGESSVEDDSPLSLSQQCHSGHTISKLQVPWTGDFSCDACGRELEEGTQVWSCAQCRRDLCSWCMPEWRDEAVMPLRVEPPPVLCPLGHRCRRVASRGEPLVSCSCCVRGDLTSWCSHFYRCETCDYNTCLQCASLQSESVEVPPGPPTTTAERGSPGEAPLVILSPNSHNHRSGQSLDGSRSPLRGPPPSTFEPLALPDVWVQL